jgi:type VI secretion system protein ImpL
VLSNPALREQLQALQQEAIALPPIVRTLVSQVGRTAEVSVMSGVASGVERQFELDVISECRRLLGGRYPFAVKGESDVPLADFGRLFGHGGLFDSFFQANLRQLVDTNQRPWAWRPGTVGASTGMLRKIEEAARVRDLFFQPGASTVGLRFTAMLGPFDPGAQRFFVDLEGLQVDSKNQQRFWTIVWPGQGAQLVTVNFEQRFGGRPTSTFHGPWALFKMIDASSPRPENDTRLVLTTRAGDLSGQLILQVDRVDNPFTNTSWRRFTCES